MHTYMLANSISEGPITNLLSILCIMIEILPCAHAKCVCGVGGGGGLNDFKFGNFLLFSK